MSRHLLLPLKFIGRRAFSTSNDFSHVKSVGIIGAGVAGLQMARACKNHGFECRVFEKAPDVGGLWRENYHSFGIQVNCSFVFNA